MITEKKPLLSVSVIPLPIRSCSFPMELPRGTLVKHAVKNFGGKVVDATRERAQFDSKDGP